MRKTNEQVDCLLLVEQFSDSVSATLPAVHRRLEALLDRFAPPGLPVIAPGERVVARPVDALSATTLTLVGALHDAGLGVAVEEGYRIFEYALDSIQSLVEEQGGVGVIAISTSYVTDPQSIHLIVHAIRGVAPRSLVVLGGQGIAGKHQDGLLAEFADVDAFVFGDGEQALVEVVRRARSGEALDGIVGVRVRGPFPAVPTSVDLDSAAMPSFWFQNPGTSMHLEEGRGCVFKCGFCTYHINNAWRRKSVDRIHAELCAIDEAGFDRVFFCGAEMITPRKETEALCRRLIEKGPRLRLGSYARLDVLAKFPHLAELMREAGWTQLFCGIESGSPEILRRMTKRYDISRIPGVVDFVQRKLGIELLASFVIGFPGERAATLEETKDLIEAAAFTAVTMDGFYPLEGSSVVMQARRHGLILDENTGAWQHPTMSSDELPAVIDDLMSHTLRRSDSVLTAFRDYLLLAIGPRGTRAAFDDLHRVLRLMEREALQDDDGLRPGVLEADPREILAFDMERWRSSASPFHRDAPATGVRTSWLPLARAR